jgi:hypothetical protein
MAQKIKIDLDPTGPLTFERDVPIPTPDGKPLKVRFTFKHRTREEMAEMSEQYMQKARDQYQQLQEEAQREKVARDEAEARGEVYMPNAPKLVDGVADAIRSDVATVMDCATDWNLDKEFNAENLAKFFRLYVGAGNAIASDYRKSMTEGRLGN